mmetsp:Transcript_34890/g.76155  ORF Transcript_34890/g.76155 Transcript_34890/m.76155 type:complete len:217 (+) Transcript_34890:368-1018(+)
MATRTVRGHFFVLRPGKPSIQGKTRSGRPNQASRTARSSTTPVTTERIQLLASAATEPPPSCPAAASFEAAAAVRATTSSFLTHAEEAGAIQSPGRQTSRTARKAERPLARLSLKRNDSLDERVSASASCSQQMLGEKVLAAQSRSPERRLRLGGQRPRCGVANVTNIESRPACSCNHARAARTTRPPVPCATKLSWPRCLPDSQRAIDWPITIAS